MVEDNLFDNYATIEMTTGKISSVISEDDSLLSNINAVADQINLRADTINFGNSTVETALNNLNSAVSIDTVNGIIYVGDRNNFYVQLSGSELGFYDKGTRVAYIQDKQLFIEKSVVVQQMDVGLPYNTVNPITGLTELGQWSWKVRANTQNPSKNNLHLKWIG